MSLYCSYVKPKLVFVEPVEGSSKIWLAEEVNCGLFLKPGG